MCHLLFTEGLARGILYGGSYIALLWTIIIAMRFLWYWSVAAAGRVSGPLQLPLLLRGHHPRHRRHRPPSRLPASILGAAKRWGWLKRSFVNFLRALTFGGRVDEVLFLSGLVAMVWENSVGRPSAQFEQLRRT